MIVDELIYEALDRAGRRKIKDVRVGLGYTCVMLEDDNCGLALTFREDLGDCCGVLNVAGGLIGTGADTIIPWAKDNHRLKAAVGLAAINAVLNDPRKDWDKGNVLEAFTLNESETFGMVGASHPIIPRIKAMTKNIYVFERKVPEGSDLYPSESIPQHLPKCDVVVLTATSIINHTIDDIVPHIKNAREACIVGPSTPLCPEVFKKYNITLLAGSVVKKPEFILQVISQAGGTMAMKPGIDQVLVRT